MQNSETNKKTAVIVLSHGSRIDEANNDVLKLIGLMEEESSSKGNITITAAFLQFGKPSLEETISKLAKEGYQEVLLAPFFLTQGVHIIQDIPEIIAKAEEQFPGVRLKVCRHLGCDQRLLPILWDRINEQYS